jgi:hypothetical protein
MPEERVELIAMNSANTETPIESTAPNSPATCPTCKNKLEGKLKCFFCGWSGEAPPPKCAVCGSTVSVTEDCSSCGFSTSGGTPEYQLLRHIAYNNWRIRKHVVFWSFFGVVLVVLGLLIAIASVGASRG